MEVVYLFLEVYLLLMEVCIWKRIFMVSLVLNTAPAPLPEGTPTTGKGLSVTLFYSHYLSPVHRDAVPDFSDGHRDTGIPGENASLSEMNLSRTPAG